MKISKIEATRESILLHTPDGDGDVTVRESAATIGEKAGRTLAMLPLPVESGTVSLPRFDGARDRIYSRFTVFQANEEAKGVRYVTDIADDVPEDTSPYPQPPTIKTLTGPARVLKELGIRQSRPDVSLPGLMTMSPGENAIPYRFNGRTYYFIRSAVEALDKQMLSAPVNTMILLNSPRLFGATGEKALLDACIHPRYDWNCPNAFISAFDMETEEGQNCYGAFVEFLVERYSRPDKKYGCAAGAVISNEVNSQYVWGNAGEMPVEQYVREYTQAMRLAWICGAKHRKSFRVYVSLDQFWHGTNFDASSPGRYYSGRRVLDLIRQYAAEDGDFNWNVAFHPYPEDLRWPDFWHDRTPDFTFSTPKITFKNMEVLEAYLSQPDFLYRGKPRRILFSEQGFNSQNGKLKDLTEKMAEAGYVLAYLKARKMKTVDMFTHHACIDNPHEFGLNLGIFRYDASLPDHVGEKKPIYASVAAMDTEKEPEAVRKARAFIGEDLFDYLLDPPLVHGDRDASGDNEFGNG